MNKLLFNFALCIFYILLAFPSLASVTATNIVVSPTVSSNGSFNVTWDVVKSDNSHYCQWFEISVIKVGTSGVFDYEETLNCDQKNFSATNYAEGQYEFQINTAYEYWVGSNYYFEFSLNTSPSVTVDLSGASASNVSETFESGWGAWSNVGSFNWLRKSGGTSSGGTGPSSAAQGSYYAYMESSSGYAYNNGNTAILESTPLSASVVTLKFKYHMYGANTGTLYLELFNGSQWTTLWSKSGQQHGSNALAWTEASVSINNPGSNAKLRFRAVAIGGYQGDIAIDHIQSSSVVTYEYDTAGRLIKTY